MNGGHFLCMTSYYMKQYNIENQGPQSKIHFPFIIHGSTGNDLSVSRPEPGTHLIASILQFSPDVVPEDRACGVKDAATRGQS